MTRQKLFLTFFGSGLSPKAPGTVGTLCAIPFGVAIQSWLGTTTLILATLLITVIAIKHINAYEQAHGLSDPSEIVIDEVAGIWLALTMTATLPLIPQVVLSFLFFRYFDIAKPSIIGRINDRPGGWGVMGDDLVAGFFAGVAAHGAMTIIQMVTT